eukprot:3870921-Ditylum_brightwellii.AAC.1
MEGYKPSFAHLNCSDLEAEEHMTKKEMFILLDKSSPNTPDACVQVIPMPSSKDDDNIGNDFVPVATPVTQRKRKCCNDASIYAVTAFTAQGRTCNPKWLHQLAKSGEAD